MPRINAPSGSPRVITDQAVLACKNGHNLQGMLPGPGPLTSGSARDLGNLGASRADSTPTRHNHESWNPNLVLAAEYANAVRNVFPAKPQHNQDGYVQHDALHYDAGQGQDTHPSSQASLKRGEAAPLSNPEKKPSKDDSELTNERVRLEAERVQARFASHVDTSTEVILRFDFMSSHDTRVSLCMSGWSNDLWTADVGCMPTFLILLQWVQVAMFVVYAATFAGFIILLVQFINIMTKVTIQQLAVFHLYFLVMLY